MPDGPADELSRVDRTAFAVVGLEESADDGAYWRTKTPEERLAALELMRSVVYGYGENPPRLQRVLEVVTRPGG